MQLHKALLLLAAASAASGADAQFHYRGSARMADSDGLESLQDVEIVALDEDTPVDTVVSLEPLPAYFFLPAVYSHYDFPDSVDTASYTHLTLPTTTRV